jgi:hypothetical protein
MITFPMWGFWAQKTRLKFWLTGTAFLEKNVDTICRISFWERLVNRLQALGLAVGLIVISIVTILHNPIAGYVRNDGLYTSAQFMHMVREKFPEYSDLSDSELLTSMRDYFSDLNFGELQKRYPVLCEPRAGYEPEKTRDRLRKESNFSKQKIVPYVLFPLDARWLYYERDANFLNRSRPELGNHLGTNEFLLGVPQARRASESRPLILPGLFDLHLHDWGSVGFPAEVNPDEGIGGLFKPEPKDLIPAANLTQGVWAALRTGWKLTGDLRSSNAKRLCRALFRYCIAIAHAPQYETDHKDALAQDWPHIPICKDQARFDHTVKLGAQVAQLLNPLTDATPVIKAMLGKDLKTLAAVHRVGGGSVKQSDLLVEYSYYGAAIGRWGKRALTEQETLPAEWGEVTGDLYLNDAVFLSHVPEDVWKYELGGYPVLKKWLGYRQANRRGESALTLGELDELRGIVYRIAALLSLRPLLDKAYNKASADAWSLEDFSAT